MKNFQKDTHLKMNYPKSSQLAGLILVLLVNISSLQGLSIPELKREMENEFEMLKRENSFYTIYNKRQYVGDEKGSKLFSI